MLKRFAGDWDATVNFAGNESKAFSQSKIVLGGFWLQDEFKGEFAGMPFEGKGTTGYDPMKKKYVSTWIDSMSPSLLVMEGEFDKDGKTFTATGEGPGPEGKPTKMKNVYEWPDANTMTFVMYNIVDGKEQQAFKINYKRRK
jgi:hypothetical protein